METLSQHDRRINEKSIKNKVYGQLTPNGIACDKCGAELVDLPLPIIRAAHPFRKPVKCVECGFKGTRAWRAPKEQYHDLLQQGGLTVVKKVKK